MTTTEPLPALLEAYFADLDRALIGTEPREHAETVQAMREHASEVLNRDGVSEKTAQRVVAEFGPVEKVAAAASAPTPAPAPARSWVDIWLLVGSVVSLAFFVFPFFAITMLVWAILRLRQNAGNRALKKAAFWVSVVSVVFSLGLFTMHFVSGL